MSKIGKWANTFVRLRADGLYEWGTYNDQRPAGYYPVWDGHLWVYERGPRQETVMGISHSAKTAQWNIERARRPDPTP